MRCISFSVFCLWSCASALTQLHAQGIRYYFTHKESLVGRRGFAEAPSRWHAAYMPDEGRTFVSLPVVPSFSFHFDSRLNFRELYDDDDGLYGLPRDYSYALRGILNPLNALTANSERNPQALRTRIGLLYVGQRIGKWRYLHVFVDEHIESYLRFPRPLYEFIRLGNEGLIGKESVFDALSLQAIHYRAIGVGYSWARNPRLRFGLRVKYLQGLSTAYSSNDFQSSLFIDNATLQHRLVFRNANIRLAGAFKPGFELLKSGSRRRYTDYLTDFRSHGLGVDFGVSYTEPAFSVHATLRDLGFIYWNNDAQVHNLSDREILYKGVESESVIDAKVLLDSLENLFEVTKEGRAHVQRLYSNLLLTGELNLSPNQALALSTTLYLIGHNLRMEHVLSYIRRFGYHLSASLSLTGYGLYGENISLGAGLVYNWGIAQFSLSSGNILAPIDARVVDVLDLNMSLLLILGRKSRAQLRREARIRDWFRGSAICP